MLSYGPPGVLVAGDFKASSPVGAGCF